MSPQPASALLVPDGHAARGTGVNSRSYACMRDVGPVPIELMIGCFLAAGLIVAAIYSVDWNSVF